MDRKHSSYERYLADISAYPRIDRDREAKLSNIIRTETNEEQVEAAITELVQANLLLVLHCLKDFRGFLHSPAVQITEMDLIAEGNIGLLNAARRFDASFDARAKGGKRAGVRFSTYACRCIKNRMHRAVKQARFIHIPEHHFGYWSELDSLRKEHGDDVADEVVRDRLDVSPEVLDLLKHGERSHTFALEDLSAEDHESCWQEILPDEKAPCPGAMADQGLLRDYLLREVQKLPSRTGSMLIFMFFDDTAPTLGDMARRYGISSERCRQVCAQGLAALRRQLTPCTDRIDPRLQAVMGS
jgi:RNA polymerase sigma factor (sigma-70 family)